MAIVEIERGQYVDPEPVESESGCFRMEPDSAAFQAYLLPRIEGARDEASLEVLASLRAGRPFGDAVLDTIQSLPAGKTKKLRDWVEEARSTRVYAYVEFSSGLLQIFYGLMLTSGGPLDEILASEQVGKYELDSFAMYWDFKDAQERLGERSEFEETPLVMVHDEEDYDEALEALEIPKKDSLWEKQGLYDFRDSPPTYAYSVESYERESMKEEAERAIEDMFSGDEWESVCATMIEG